MRKDHDDSFQSLNIGEKIVVIVCLTLLVLFAIALVLGMYFFGFAGAFELLGVHYQSVWTLLLFIGSLVLVGIFIDLPFDVIRRLAARRVNQNLQAFVIQVFISFVSNWLVLTLVDAWMTRITLSSQTTIILALALAVVEAVFDDKKKPVDA